MKKIAAVFILLLLNGCNRIDKDDLKVVGGLQLGLKPDDYVKQCDSLGLKSTSFYTKMFFTNPDEVSQSKIRAYYTDIFDFPEYVNSKNNIHHYALLIPEKDKEYNGITSIYLLIGHVNGAIGLKNNGELFDLTKATNYSVFNQDVTTGVLDKIEAMLVKEYGNPNYDSVKENNFYKLEGSGSYPKVNGNGFGKKKIWETSNFKLTYFKGFENKATSFNKFEKNYNYSLKGNIINLNAVEFYTNQFAYIKYELNEDIKKELFKDVEIKL